MEDVTRCVGLVIPSCGAILMVISEHGFITINMAVSVWSCDATLMVISGHGFRTINMAGSDFIMVVDIIVSEF